MTITNTFSPNTVISSSQMNTNLQTDIRDKFNASMHSSTGHNHDATSGSGPAVVLQDASPNSEREIGFASGDMQYHDGTAARSLATLDTAQEFTGDKTFSGTTIIESPNVQYSDGEFIEDDNSNELLEFGVVASAVNQVKITNAATGNAPIIEPNGETNVDLLLRGKGTGKVDVTAAKTGYVDLGDTGSGTVTANMALGNTFRMRATGNFTLAVSNPSDGQRATFIIRQDGSGSRLVTVPTNFRWLNGTGATNSTTDKPALTTAANKVDIFTGIYDATLSLWWMSVAGFNGAVS